MNDHLLNWVGASLLTTLIGIILLSALGRPIHDSLPYAATALVGAVAGAMLPRASAAARQRSNSPKNEKNEKTEGTGASSDQ